MVYRLGVYKPWPWWTDDLSMKIEKTIKSLKAYLIFPRLATLPQDLPPVSHMLTASGRVTGPIKQVFHIKANYALTFWD